MIRAMPERKRFFSVDVFPKCNEMWLILLPIFANGFVTHAIPVFTFNATTSMPAATPSFAYLVRDFDLPESFVLCLSVKQMQFDDVGFVSLNGGDSREWLKVRFFTFFSATNLTLWWNDKFHNLGALQTLKLDFWYHICLKIDLGKGRILTAVNGEPMGEVHDENVTNIPRKLSMKNGVGYSDEQFHGSVGKIELYKAINVTNASALPCEVKQNVILPWNPNWKLVGSQGSLTKESEGQFCVENDFYQLAIPSNITFQESLDICKQKLNDSIIPFQRDHEVFLEYNALLVKITGGDCPYIWTPFSDQKKEGTFLNMNDNTEAAGDGN